MRASCECADRGRAWLVRLAVPEAETAPYSTDKAILEPPAR